MAQSGTTVNPYLYTGQRFDAATDTYYLRAREYDPVVGRFLSRDTWALDTWNPAELNRYVYAAANPVTWSDPSGRATSLLGRILADSLNVGIGSITLPKISAFAAISLLHILMMLELVGLQDIVDELTDVDENEDEDEEEKCDYRVLRYIDQPSPRPKNCQAHHPMPNAWMDAHYTNYSHLIAWTILMPYNPDHLATREVQAAWMAVTYGYRNFPWKQVSYEEMRLVANQMLDTTHTPQLRRQEYWRHFEEYRLTLVPRR